MRSLFIRRIYRVVLLVVAMGISACGGGGGGPSLGGGVPPDVEALEAEITAALDAADTDVDFTLAIRAGNGHSYTYRSGDSTEFTVYRSASTSKWVTAAVILDLVKDGVLSLEDRPQDYLSFWPTEGNLSQISLAQLLSFTSGLANEPLCMNRPLVDFESCVQQIPAENDAAPVPGTEFYYSGAHMQVAGLMAVHASQVDAWTELFAAFQGRYGLFPSAVYDLPSVQNPRLAGGMHWTGAEYLDFLGAIYAQSILSPALLNAMMTDQLGGAAIVYSPAESGAGVDWHYGFGNWIECRGIPFDCAETQKVSSPGAYGAYPFIDFQHGYYGILAREGALGSFVEGYSLFAEVEDLLQQWAAKNQ